ncbi:MAG: hypothetical protein GY811_12480 [Myxococcales bacterium]|nr:hypothetical protein [Myxococcales bacterium]
MSNAAIGKAGPSDRSLFALGGLDEEEASKHSELIRGLVQELVESGTGIERIEELACRTIHCRIRLASGDAQGLVKLADALQDERGFLGKAESIMLSRQGDDIVFYLWFYPPK